MKGFLGGPITVLAAFAAACGSDGGGEGTGAPDKLTCNGTDMSLGAECSKVYSDIAACCNDKTIGAQKATEVVCGMQANETACKAGGPTAGAAGCSALKVRPECTATTPGKDATGGDTAVETAAGDPGGTADGLVWEEPPKDQKLVWDEAKAYCDDLSLDGMDDWRLPSVDEFRKFIKGCPKTEFGGACPRSTTCLDPSCATPDCNGCDFGGGPAGKYHCYWDPKYAVGNECGAYWTSTLLSGGGSAITINFNFGRVDEGMSSNPHRVRCVRGP